MSAQVLTCDWCGFTSATAVQQNTNSRTGHPAVDVFTGQPVIRCKGTVACLRRRPFRHCNAYPDTGLLDQATLRLVAGSLPCKKPEGHTGFHANPIKWKWARVGDSIEEFEAQLEVWRSARQARVAS